MVCKFLSMPETSESFVLKTNMEKYIDFNSWKLISQVTNGPLRSKAVWNRPICAGDIASSRVILHFPWQYKARYDCWVGDQVTELTTTLHLESLPRKLESLSYLAWSCDKQAPKKPTTEFPSGLVRLRVQQDMVDHTRQVPYQLGHLKHLKYLVIVDNFIGGKGKKKLIRLAIENQLRMLCFVSSWAREGYKKVPRWYTKIETTYTHAHPRLARHYYIYKRKFLQLQLMYRTRLLAKSFWAENAVNFANCAMEVQLEEEYEHVA